MAIAQTKIPGPPGLPVIGNLLDVGTDVLSFLQKVASYGDVAQLGFFNRKITLVSHPDLIQQVLIRDNDQFEKDSGTKMLAKFVLGKGLLTAEGEEHKRMRKNTSPAFNRQRILSYGKIMTDLADQQSAAWKNGATIDMHSEMMAVTSAIVAKALFNMDVSEKVHAIGEALEKVMRIVDVIRMPFSDIAMQLPLPATLEIREGIETLDKIIYETIDEHLADSDDKGDLLSMMISSRREAGDDMKKARKQLRDEAMTLFLAGHETTANALTWTFYLLSQNADKYDALCAEVDRVLKDRPATIDDIAALPYTRQVVSESMRLYPPAWVIGRTVCTTTKSAATSYPRAVNSGSASTSCTAMRAGTINPRDFCPSAGQTVKPKSGRSSASFRSLQECATASANSSHGKRQSFFWTSG